MSPPPQVSCARSTPQSAGLGALGFARKFGKAPQKASGSGDGSAAAEPCAVLVPSSAAWDGCAVAAGGTVGLGTVPEVGDPRLLLGCWGFRGFQLISCLVGDVTRMLCEARP